MRRRFLVRLAALPVFLLFAAPSLTPAAGAAAHDDPLGGVVLALAVILAAAKLGGEVAVRLGQPAVLGELLAGVGLGSLDLAGFTGLSYIAHDPAIAAIAGLGVVILLFEVGLESTVADMAKVGAPALAVAVVGVVAPFAFGWGAGAWLLPEESFYVHAFLGATLTATSVGITARVLQDLRRSKSAEARIILGAAVIDDVLGLVILAVVTGVIQAAAAGNAFSWAAIALVVAKALGFLGAALLLGTYLSRPLYRFASHLRVSGVLLALSLAFCFFLAFLASRVGLAPIVGAYAAGLILEDLHFRDFEARGERTLEDLVKPLVSVIVPVFFVLMGMNVDLAEFAQPGVLLLATALTVGGIAGKQACGLAAFSPGIDRLSIGIGMVPRGEVGLIFADVGRRLVLDGQPVIEAGVFSAVVIMVIVTTLVTPPALRWSLSRGRR
jgi:Kef-type K+ transport system membrane component KefB